MSSLMTCSQGLHVIIRHLATGFVLSGLQVGIICVKNHSYKVFNTLALQGIPHKFLQNTGRLKS